MAEKEPTFEESLDELEAIIAELETGDLPLDEMIERYEKGVKALELCRKVLDDAEKRIEILLKDKDGELQAEPFDTEEAEDGGGKDE
ncbi:MAG: exodeoxyribonuclease VII small subunit [Planctomycetota bacterium]